jgi:hypothetical protein
LSVCECPGLYRKKGQFINLPRFDDISRQSKLVSQSALTSLFWRRWTSKLDAPKALRQLHSKMIDSQTLAEDWNFERLNSDRLCPDDLHFQ